MLTSANAIRHGGAGLERLRSLPVHAVGEATAAAAREAGFAVAGIGEGGCRATWLARRRASACSTSAAATIAPERRQAMTIAGL